MRRCFLEQRESRLRKKPKSQNGATSLIASARGLTEISHTLHRDSWSISCHSRPMALQHCQFASRIHHRVSVRTLEVVCLCISWLGLYLFLVCSLLRVLFLRLVLLLFGLACALGIVHALRVAYHIDIDIRGLSSLFCSSRLTPFLGWRS